MRSAGRTARRLLGLYCTEWPWQGLHREITTLNPDYWLDLEEQGYALARELAVFKPEV